MKKRTVKLSLLPLIFALPVFVAQADNDGVSKEELKQELDPIQQRLAALDVDGETSSAASNTSINFYGSLRPTFGVTMTGSEDVWDVGDALSRLGIYSEHKVNDSLVAFARGEFKVNIQANGDFGEARKAYVGIKGNFGRVAIGKQSSTQYRMIADPVDICKRSYGLIADGVNREVGLAPCVQHQECTSCCTMTHVYTHLTNTSSKPILTTRGLRVSLFATIFPVQLQQHMDAQFWYNVMNVHVTHNHSLLVTNHFAIHQGP